MKIAVAGYGAEGESSYRYWNTPENQVVIVDEQQPSHEPPVDASVIVGEGAYSKLAGYDLVVRTAGLAPRKIQTDGKVWSATNEFFAKCPATIIGVTGSKGKGTTSSLIVSILRAGGKNVHLVGNIGVPALDVLPEIKADDIVVYELSSFQLWDAEKSPHVAVVLMIEPDHLDVHTDMDEYVDAKANIRRHQGCMDVCIYHPTNEYSRRIATTPTDTHQDEYCDGGMDAFYRFGIASEGQVYVKDDMFMQDDRRVASVDALKLAGQHNIENACAAISAVLCIEPVARKMIEQGLSDFTGLPHRLKFVRAVNGVQYYDDSIATTPGSAIAAMHAFDQPKVIILGGSSKGAQFDEVAKVAAESNVKTAILIGQEADRIEQVLREQNIATVNMGNDVAMSDLITEATRHAEKDDVVILSPACASFGMFKNYNDRGDQFVAAVNAIEEL
ncbi:MAG: putative UDP-N-acetylmuramoylalanine--D-glutamate ligase [Candidatus Saccharibacteria bacterium]|nr:putative UDP-N-acetylmuramoylalanine--D-glutamate ligase [Candidatus Saccharibacteria bacterium]